MAPFTVKISSDAEQGRCSEKGFVRPLASKLTILADTTHPVSHETVKFAKEFVLGVQPFTAGASNNFGSDIYGHNSPTDRARAVLSL